MRVWDIHPGYLSRSSLLGQHAEIHGIFNTIVEEKKGYSRHPETVRWSRCPGKLATRHDLTVKEMELRGFKHNSPCSFLTESERQKTDYIDNPARQFQILKEKYSKRPQAGRIPLPKRRSDFWAHHKYSVMARGYNHYKRVQEFMNNCHNAPIEEDKELIQKVLCIMDEPVCRRALNNTVDHIWGYFKNSATDGEKDTYLNLASFDPTLLMPFFYKLADKYDQQYLFKSTVFADFTRNEDIIDSAKNPRNKNFIKRV